MSQQFQVQRDALSTTRLADVSSARAADEVTLSVDRFALTANNITYGVAGDMIGYWQFFPAEGDWGQIPVWGIGTVVESDHPEMPTGKRVYGYFPMAQQLIVKPEKVTDRGFVDAAAHRAALPPVYNQYSWVDAENGFAEGFDNHAMLYRPLFTTSFVLDDFLADNDFFGATQVILGSASSKTAFGLAYMLKRREGLKVVGLTSPGNVAFVESLGLYDEVLTYDRADQAENVPSAYVDMAGNRSVLSALHHHLQDNMVCSCGVGITHWEDRDGDAPEDLPGAKPTMFFAPSQIIKRNEELGPAVYQDMLGSATHAFFADVDQWVKVEEHPFADVDAIYQAVLKGIAPDRGIIVTQS